jgi:hypothetical protein
MFGARLTMALHPDAGRLSSLAVRPPAVADPVVASLAVGRRALVSRDNVG